MPMKVGFGVLLVASTLSIALAAKPNCIELKKKSDECVRKALFIGDDDAVAPTTTTQLQEYCVEKKGNMICAIQVKKCLKNVPKQLVGVVFSNMQKMFKEYCYSNRGQQDFLRHMKCVKTEHLKILQNMFDKLTIALKYIAANVSREETIPWACCTYFQGYADIPRAMANLCAPEVTDPATIDFFRALYKRVASDVIDLGCGRYGSVSECEANLPQGTRVLRDLVASERGLLPQNSSFILPLIRIAERLDQD